jgi:carbamoyltransferase
MRNYIGLALTPHDPAIAVVNSRGELVFAEASERHLQSKRAWNASPDDLIRIGHIIRQHVEPGSDIVLSCTWRRPSLGSVFLTQTLTLPVLRKMLAPASYAGLLALGTGIFTNSVAAGLNTRWQASQIRPDAKVTLRTFDHHFTHAAAACFSSPYREAKCVIVDGYGEGLTTTRVYQYRNGLLSPVKRIRPSRWVSLGLFYDAVCAACGFDPLRGEEWKVMGLAGYGRFDPKIYATLRSYLTVKNGRMRPTAESMITYNQIAEMGRRPDEPVSKAADLACTAQLVFSEWMKELLTDVHRLSPSPNLVLGGGCALNSSLNGQILENTPFEDLYVYFAPADDGNAVGAALQAFRQDNPHREARDTIQLPYLGESMSGATLDRSTRYGGLLKRLPLDKTVPEYAAELLASGKIVGWVQGRAEFGPRALGNRSILADPRAADIKDRINERVKLREEFRPFAPSILHEFGHHYFENYQESPYMERALRFRKDVVQKVPGVVHVDGTGRLQTVKREWNEKFFELVSAFNRLTGIPLVLNTSFNVMGKPIIHTVEDALSVFMTTGMDALVIEDYVFEKRLQ